MHILRCMRLKFCVKFLRAPLKFHTKFEHIHCKICIFPTCIFLWFTISWSCNVISLIETTPCKVQLQWRHSGVVLSHIAALFSSIHWRPVVSPRKGPVMRNAFPCHNVIIQRRLLKAKDINLSVIRSSNYQPHIENNNFWLNLSMKVTSLMVYQHTDVPRSLMRFHSRDEVLNDVLGVPVIDR